MTASQFSPTPGEAKNSWLTGTAAWSFVVLTQYILGVKPDFNGLRIDPCIPKDWQEFTVKRSYRSAVYNIHISNPGKISKGIQSITVDGKSIDGNLLPDFQDGKIHNVKVIMG